MNIRLTEEQRESLEAFMESDGFNVFMQIVIPQFKQFQADKILKGPDVELLVERAKYQGLELFEFRMKEFKGHILGKQATAK